MWNLYGTVAHDHDLRFVALAVGICTIGCLTGAGIARHSIRPETEPHRLQWLILAGFVTGLSIWTTHFTAMLGYRAGVETRFDLVIASISLLLCISLTTIGCVVGLLGRRRGLLGGALVGVGIAGAHYLGLHALRVPGAVTYDLLIGSLALACVVVLGALAGQAFVRWNEKVLAWPAAFALAAAVLSVHLVSISGIAISPGTEPVADSLSIGSANELATAVVAAFLVILAVAAMHTWHSGRVAKATAEETRARQKLQETQDHHRAYVELTPQIAWVADPQGQVTEIAPRWSELVGIPRENAYGQGWTEVIHPDDLPLVRQVWREAIKTVEGDRADVRYRIRQANGEYRWFRARARPRLDESGRVVAWYGSLDDIHDQVIAETALRAGEERYRLASRATSDVIWDWSFEQQRATWAGAHKKILGFPELQGETDLSWWLDRIHPEDRDRVLESQTTALNSDAGYWHEEYRFLVVTGDWIDVRSRCVIVRNETGKPIRMVGSMLDITQQKKAEAELNWAAHHDPLTRLPNRTLYSARKRAALDAARESGKFVAVMILDLNNFKELNDTLGHASGDLILTEAARRLLAAVPENATVARLGGDEFAIILPALATTDAYRDVADRITENLADPFDLQEMRVPVSFCAGVAIWPRDCEDPGELLIAADLALYAAKAEMPGTILEFTPSFREASEQRSRMLATARSALQDDRIVPFYQPKIDLHNGQITGWEALLRVRNDDGAILPPAEIAAAFSDAEISVQLTDRMFSRVLADLAAWRSVGGDPGRIAINVAAGDFRHRGLVERLRGQAHASGIDLSRLDIEVTETVLIGELGPEVSRMLEELRALGVRVALDDFGTGYASLTHLQQFPVDVIKIDKSFIERIESNDPKATAVIDAVIQMARRLGMTSVAEGVETPDQARYLRARGCNLAQGFFFSRPVPASEVASILERGCFDQWAFLSAACP